jgi:hypothetical protein
MIPSRPEQMLKREPLQWGRDFCEDLLEFLRDPEIPDLYKMAYCRHMRGDLLAARRSLQGKGTHLAGGAMVVAEGFTALRFLILNFLEICWPRAESGYDNGPFIFLERKIEFLQDLLMEMETTLEADPPWPECIQKGLTLLREKGLSAHELPLQSPGRVPLSAFILPYGQQGSPACYLKDLHAILLFKSGNAGLARDIRTQEDVRVAAENIFLHELGHAFLARMLREQDPGFSPGSRGLLARCLRKAAHRTVSRQGGERETATRLAESFCHVFVSTILAKAGS